MLFFTLSDTCKSKQASSLIVTKFLTHIPKSSNHLIYLGWFMVLNATFNNISVISWWSVLLVEETRVPGENH